MVQMLLISDFCSFQEFFAIVVRDSVQMIDFADPLDSLVFEAFMVRPLSISRCCKLEVQETYEKCSKIGNADKVVPGAGALVKGTTIGSSERSVGESSTPSSPKGMVEEVL